MIVKSDSSNLAFTDSPVDSIVFTTAHKYKVLEVLKKSTARYAKEIRVGDTLSVDLILEGQKVDDGLYSTGCVVYANGKLVGTATPSEVTQLFLRGKDSILKVEEL